MTSEAFSHPNTGSEGVKMKMSDVLIGDVEVSDAQSGRGSKKDGADVSHLEAVGHLYAIHGTIKQMSFVSEKH